MALVVQVDGIAFTVATDANGCFVSATCASYPKTGQPLTVQLTPSLDPSTDIDTIAQTIEDGIPLDFDNTDVTAIATTEGGTPDPTEGAIRESYGGG